MRIGKQHQMAIAIRECSEQLREMGREHDVLDRLAEVEAVMLRDARRRLKPRRITLPKFTVRLPRMQIHVPHITFTLPHPTGAVRRVVQRWTAPRLGLLVHHDPVPLTVPAHYARVAAPSRPPLISIATPSYNQADFLDRTIASVLGQGYPRLEYVVQDAASTDHTRQVLERWNGRVGWISEPDRGQADGINRGLARTTGEIMGYLNSDDMLLPGALAVVGRYFHEHHEVDAVYGHRVLIDGEDRRIGSWIVPRHDDETLRWADYVPQETLFWRRSLWDRVGGRIDDSFAYALDWDLLLRFLDAGARIHRIPRFLGAFRVHDAQKTTANADVGEREVALLRERSHGRPISQEEVMEHVARYLRRHVTARAVERMREALHPRRLHVLAHLDSKLPTDRALTG